MRLLITTVVMVLCSWTLVQSQDTRTLFTVVEDAEAVLSAEENQRFDKLDEGFILEKTLVDLTGIGVTVQNQQQDIPLRSESRGLQRVRVNFQDNENFTYAGKFRDHEGVGEVYLYRTGGFLYGNIHIDSLAFQVEPISREYAALVRRDYGQFDVCPLDGHDHEEDENKDRNKEKQKNQNEQLHYESSSMNSVPVIDVMVLFSNQAAAATTNMGALAEGSIQSSNDAFGNSNADVSFNLVHHQQVGYNESGDLFQDRDCIVGTNNQCIDFIHDLRDEHAADVVVLMVDQAVGFCGLATGIEVDEELAFAVVRNDCSIGNYTFAHEIGHLAGARHDNDPNDAPRPYAHGLRYEPAFWRTVMAVEQEFQDPVNRIPYWSSPDNTFGGVAMGTPNWNDNVRVWNERAETMAEFRSQAPPPPSVSISGPSNMFQGSTDTFTANVSGGSPPYSYQWFYRHENDCCWNSTGVSSQTYTHTAGPPNGEHVRVVVQDQYPHTEEDQHFFTILGWSMVAEDSSLPDEISLTQNYPNPFNPSSTIRYELPERAEVSLAVYNMLGQRVALLVDGEVQPGRHEAVFEASNLSSGNYIARFSALGTSGEPFEQTLNMQLVK